MSEKLSRLTLRNRRTRIIVRLGHAYWLNAGFKEYVTGFSSLVIVIIFWVVNGCAKMSSDAEFVNESLGINSQLGRKLGLSDDFCLQIIKQVGNYKDVYDKHLGPETKFDLPRGVNSLFVDGGLHYPLPLK